MSIKLVDTLESMGNFPVANASGIQFSDGEDLQKKLDDGSLGGGVEAYIELSQEEYDALSDEEKANGTEYRTYDTGRIYKYGVLYGGKEPVELTWEAYQELEADGLVDPDTDYIIIGNESGILLASEDVSYNNSASGLDATTVQGAVDKIVEKINEKSEISDSTTDTQTTWSSSKIAATYVTKNDLNQPRYTGLINGNSTVDTGWSLEQRESRRFGRLLQLDGHEGAGALSYSFIIFVKANHSNATEVICKQIVGMYEDYELQYTRFFELGISANKTLTITNKSGVQTSYKFI